MVQHGKSQQQHSITIFPKHYPQLQELQENIEPSGNCLEASVSSYNVVTGNVVFILSFTGEVVVSVILCDCCSVGGLGRGWRDDSQCVLKI